jgi:hypothetical protein
VKSNARSLIIAIATLLGFLVWSGSALADDYGVDFGVEIDAGKDRGRDAGTVGCVFTQTCRAKVEPFGLEVSFVVYRDDTVLAKVYLSSGDPTCCYFQSSCLDANDYLVCRSLRGSEQGAPYISRTSAWALSTLDSITAESR